uniref:Membrane skeletal protein, putative n=1 Tax=Babesia bovis TaxID=5865 RepID=S6BAG4_BABBO|nr:membrane skeletal protein, putative [Babesia bovis]
MPKVEVKVVPKYVEVPVVKIVDRYEEYEEVEEMVKEVEKIEIVEVPREVVKHVVKPVKKIIEQERIVPITEHRDVPIEKVKFVPKIETVELIREIPKVIDVPVPYNVPKVEYVDKPYVVPEYRDVQVAVPVRKKVTPVYHYQGEPEVINVPIHRPYFVIHDHITFKPASQPIAENMKVVGVRPIDLNGLSESERVEAQNRLRNAVRNPIPDGGNVVHSPSSAQASPVVDTTNVVMAPQSYAPNVAQHISTNVELPPKAMATPMEPHFGIAKTPSRKSDRPTGSIETIIYKNHKNAPVSPMSDIGHGDVYPRSSNNTPRMIS